MNIHIKMNAKTFGNLASYMGLIVVIVVFNLLTGGALLGLTNLQAMSNQMIVTALATIGAVFVFGAGFFDMSFGGCVCLSAVIGGLSAISTGSLVVAALAILATALVLGLVKGLLAAYVDVPFFIFTIVLSTIISAAVLQILGSETTIYLKNAVKEIPAFDFTQMSFVNVIALLFFFLICVVLFCYTPLGLKLKNMGGNILSARQSGIDEKRTTIIVFLISSLGIAFAAFIILIRTRTVGSITASTLGNDVMVALVLGGMPLSGGSRSKISAGLIGAATITALNSGLTIMGLSTGQIQICRGIVFVLVVFISSFSYRNKLLPR